MLHVPWLSWGDPRTQCMPHHTMACNKRCMCPGSHGATHAPNTCSTQQWHATSAACALALMGPPTHPMHAIAVVQHMISALKGPHAQLIDAWMCDDFTRMDQANNSGDMFQYLISTRSRGLGDITDDNIFYPNQVPPLPDNENFPDCCIPSLTFLLFLSPHLALWHARLDPARGPCPPARHHSIKSHTRRSRGPEVQRKYLILMIVGYHTLPLGGN